jgi:hypothetical protein
VFLDFLKKKLQDAVGKPAAKAAEGADADYEERRARAQGLYDEGQTAEAVTLLEELAAELAGAGNFPLAVAVRHQIAQWRPDLDDSAMTKARKMAHQRAASDIAPKPMTNSSITRILSLSPLLEELTVDEIKGLIESTGLMKYPRGQVVIEEGTPGDQLYVVTRGILEVTTIGADGNRVRVGTLSVGDFFGEVSVLTGKPRSATVRSETDAECLQITAERWRQLSASHAHLRELLEDALKLRASLTAEAVVSDLRKRRSGVLQRSE